MNKTALTIAILLTATLLSSGIEAVELSAKEDGSYAIPELDCIIEPSEIVDVGSAVPGVVEAIDAERNDQVAKGTVIARLESSVERATFELSKERASLDTAIELRLEGARFGHLTQTRNKSLRKTAAISEHELDAVVSETRIAELQVRQERDNKRIAGLELLRAQAVLDRRTIRSPVDGVVTDRFKSAGEYVDDEPVLRVAQLDPLHVEVIVSTDYLGRIKTGMQAQVTPAIPEADTYLATVERVDRVSDAASGTYGVRLSLANPDYTIPAGLRCRLGFVPHVQSEATDIAEVVDIAEVTNAIESIDATNPEEDAEVTEDSEVAAVVEPAADLGPIAAELETEASRPAVPEPIERTVTPVENTLVSNTTDRIVPATAVSELVQVKEKEQPGSCHTIGPFTKERTAKRWFDGLQETSEKQMLRDETPAIASDFIVLASFKPGPKALQSLIGNLNKAGITDRYVFRSGVRKGNVSLGVYRYNHLAVKRQEELAAKGIAAKIEPRSSKSRHYWIDLSLPAGAHLPKWMAKLPAKASAKSVICSAQFAHL